MTNKKSFLAFLVLFLGLLIIVFRSLVSNISSNLYSWLDFPYVIWLIYQGIGKISNFSFANFGATNAFYPLKDSYYFSDLFLPQAVGAYPFSLFIKNPVLVVNIVFVLTFVLNYVSLFLYWKLFFKKNWQCFLASVVLIFSPFLQLQFGHFQMQSYWPLFFSLYFFCKNKNFNLKDLFLSGLFLVVQFLSSVYLSVFLIFTLCLKTLINIISKKNIKEIKSILSVFLVFLIAAAYFIYGYIQVKKNYSFVRDYGEYVTYSAHVSDYFFTSGINSVVSNSLIYKKWNSFNKHDWGEMAAFPGFAVTIAVLFYLFKISYKEKVLKIKIKLNNDDLFFILLLIFGLLFSIGPRINFNGAYSGIPTPYTFLIKYIPFFDSVRGLARWSFLFYFGLSYFFVKYLSNKKIWLIFIFVIIFLLENFPLSLISTNENYIDSNSDYILNNYCSKNKAVLLEIPMNHLMVGTGVIDGLNYISKRQLASIYTNCLLVNGYSGYEPPEQTKYYEDVDNALSNKKLDKFLTLLKNRNITFVRITPELIVANKKDNYLEVINRMMVSKKLLKLSVNLYMLVL